MSLCIVVVKWCNNVDVIEPSDKATEVGLKIRTCNLRMIKEKFQITFYIDNEQWMIDWLIE